MGSVIQTQFLVDIVKLRQANLLVKRQVLDGSSVPYVYGIHIVYDRSNTQKFCEPSDNKCVICMHALRLKTLF